MVTSEISSELGVGTERTALEGMNNLDAKGGARERHGQPAGIFNSATFFHFIITR